MTSIPVSGGSANPDEPSSQPPRNLTDLPAIAFSFDDMQHAQLSASNVLITDYVAELLRHASRASRIQVELSGLQSWPPDSRRAALSVLKQIEGGTCSEILARSGVDANAGGVFSAILSGISADRQPEDRMQAIRTAIEAAAILHPDAIESACNDILSRIREAGQRGFRIERIISDARSVAGSVQRCEQREGLPMIEIWPDAPLADLLVAPAGWHFSERGVTPQYGGREELIPVRIVITKLISNIEDQTCSTELAFSRGDSWKTLTIERENIAAARQLVALSRYGVAVTSNNADDLVEYLLALEEANYATIPRARESKRMGWIGERGEQGFLLGNTLITADDSPTDGQAAGGERAVVFGGADTGDTQIADGLISAGDWSEWLSVLQAVHDYPRVLLAIYSALAPPLLPILNAHNFVVSFAGPTSSGKTTVARLAASCWGNPEERDGCGGIMSWDTTRVGAERSMAVLNCLPIVMDDTKRASKPDAVAQLIYDVASGRGKTRGSKRGLAGNSSWWTVLITNGEQPLASFTEDGGTRARIFECWGSPFERTDQATAELIPWIHQQILTHHGHAGRRFVQYLASHRSQWSVWREHYQNLRRSYTQRAGGNAVAGRAAEHFAVLQIAAEIAHTSLNLPFEYAGTVQSLWPELTRDTVEADRATEALRCLVDWCHAHEHLFEDRRPTNTAITNENPGRWCLRRDVAQGGDCLALFPGIVKRVVQNGGFDPHSTRRLWQDRNWLCCSPGKSTLKVRSRADSASKEMVAIRWSAVREINEDADPEVERGGDSG